MRARSEGTWRGSEGGTTTTTKRDTTTRTRPPSRCSLQVPSQPLQPQVPSQSLQPQVPSQSLQPQVPLTVAAMARSKPPGASHSRCSPPRFPSQSLQVPGQSHQVPLTVAAAPRCPSQSLQPPGCPLQSLQPSRCPSQLGPFSYRSSWARCRAGPVRPAVVPAPLDPLS